jgi:hypothetical protein
MYPAESRLIDVSDLYWLFGIRPGERVPRLYRQTTATRHKGDLTIMQSATDGIVPEGYEEATRMIKGEPNPEGMVLVRNSSKAKTR